MIFFAHVLFGKPGSSFPGHARAVSAHALAGLGADDRGRDFCRVVAVGRSNAAERTAADAEVYRDQLDEIERDRASGVIGVPEAEAARVEVSRRLLAAADAKPPPALAAATRLRHRRSAAVTTLVFVPLGAVALYLLLGSPNLPGQPLAQRLTAPSGANSMAGLIARVETHLEQNPDDGRGWEVIAPVYMRLGRFDDAIRAFRSGLRLNGENADRQANLGEALIGAANGVITSDAKAAFERALALDASNPRAQFYLGLAAEQDGRSTDAVERWRKLIGAGASRRTLDRIRAPGTGSPRSNRGHRRRAGPHRARRRQRRRHVGFGSRSDGAWHGGAAGRTPLGRWLRC